MSKYIDAEKLIAEIERRIEETKSMKPSFDQFWAGQISAFKGVKNIITSLQQEQPEVDLDVDFVFDEIMSIYDSNNCLPPRDEESLEMLEKIARHFWNNGYNARNEE